MSASGTAGTSKFSPCGQHHRYQVSFANVLAWRWFFLQKESLRNLPLDRFVLESLLLCLLDSSCAWNHRQGTIRTLSVCCWCAVCARSNFLCLLQLFFEPSTSAQERQKKGNSNPKTSGSRQQHSYYIDSGTRSNYCPD